MAFCLCLFWHQEAYSVARQFNLIPPVCEQAEYHYFQRDKVEVQLPELYHKIGQISTRLTAQFIFIFLNWRFVLFHSNVHNYSCLPGVGAMTWSPLACGLITGKYSDGVPECSRAAMKVSLIWAVVLMGFLSLINEVLWCEISVGVAALWMLLSWWRDTSGWRSEWTARRAADSWQKSRSSIYWPTDWAALLHS